MKDKTKYYQDLKDIIIVCVLDYLDVKNFKYKEAAIKQLTEFAKFYNVPLRHKAGLPKIKIHLREFILNDTGNMYSIPNLYNSLKN